MERDGWLRVEVRHLAALRAVGERLIDRPEGREVPHLDPEPTITFHDG